MKNVYAMLVIIIVLFIASMDFLFVTNIFIDLLIVVFFLILIARGSLKLSTNVVELEGTHILKEKKIAYFAPLIFLLFLSTAISFGIIAIIVNVLIIAVIGGYILVSITRNKIIVTNNSITAEYLNGHSVIMKWVDIVEVDFDWIYNMIIFKDSEGAEIKLDISLEDFLLVITMMKERLLKDDYENAFRKLKIYYWCFLMYPNIIHLN